MKQDPYLAADLPKRDEAAHKGNFGHVLIIGGAPGMSGAPHLSALGALRVGAGKVSLATYPAHALYLNLTQPEMMCHGIKNTTQLEKLLDKVSVLVVGPGFGQSRWAKKLTRAAFASQLPMIVDADALHMLADTPSQRDNWILTPHPGEAADLLKVEVASIQVDRETAVRDLQKKYQGIAILKGHHTIVADHQRRYVCQSGNPGMASGGMGDLLTGILAGLIAQGMSLFDAACFGVTLHAQAGDRVAENEGQRGMLATDLLPYVRQLLNQI